MSEVIAVSLISAGSALTGILVTQSFHWLRRKQEQEESYKLKLYEKRLEVHQKGYKWLVDLIGPLREAIGSRKTNSAVESEAEKTLRGLHQEAARWWNDNCLYLDEESRTNLDDFMKIAGEFLHTSNPPDLSGVDQKYDTALQTVIEGIGMKHIEEKKVEPVDG